MNRCIERFGFVGECVDIVSRWVDEMSDSRLGGRMSVNFLSR
jgi:hypothetical protein